MEAYVDTYTASVLTDDGGDNRVREKIARGEYAAKKRAGVRGGVRGEAHLVALSSLPMEAQITYLLSLGEMQGHEVSGVDLAGYKAKHGEKAIEELLAKLNAVQAIRAMQTLGAKGRTDKLDELAAGLGVSRRALYRYADAYELDGVRGLMIKGKANKGKPASLCLLSQAFIKDLYYNQVKRRQSVIYDMLCKHAADAGGDACRACPFNDASEARQKLIRSDKAGGYPACGEENKTGMLVPECRQTVSRYIQSLPAGTAALARRGVKAWEAAYMPKATRDKPEKVNEVWFGDHHQFDLFVLTDDGKLVRPWITGCYDAASGALIGYYITLQPNSDTIMEAFVRAIPKQNGVPFWGVPACFYMDNGKDYRSKRFEGGKFIEVPAGLLNDGIKNVGILQALNVGVIHALPYRGWSKTIERFFGTLENRWIREMPGWCGNSPEERPEDFAKELRGLIDKGKLLTFDEFKAHFESVILPEYHNTAFDGGKTPLEIYASMPKARTDVPGWDTLSLIKMEAAERKVMPGGIKFENRLYWDDALSRMVGEFVQIRFNRTDTSTITVLHDGRYICEAELKRNMKLVGEEPDIIAAHMRMQQNAKRAAKEEIAGAKRAVRLAGIEKPADRIERQGTYELLEGVRAAKGKRQKKQELESRKAREYRAGADAAEDYLRKNYREIVRGGN